MADMSLESEQFIDEVVAARRFENRHEALDEAVRLLRSEIQKDSKKPADLLTATEWCEWFEKWASSHRSLSHEVDDSRESIYAGRGE